MLGLKPDHESQPRRSWKAAAYVAGLAAASLLAASGGCRDSGTTNEDIDIPFGLGAKADQVCPPDAELCWPEDQEAAMRAVQAASDRLRAGDVSAAPDLAAGLQSLSVKLTEKERAALDDLESEALLLASMDPEVLQPGDEDDPVVTFFGLANEAGLERLTGLYTAAHTVPLASWTEAQLQGKADAPETADLPAPEGLTPDMRRCLDELEGNGLVGKVYSFLFQATGVLDAPPAPMLATPGQGPSREELCDQIRMRYRWAAVRESVIAGAESLIPIAGFVLSFSHGTLMSFRDRARQAMELAAVFGIDVRKGDNLLFVAGVTSGAMEDEDVMRAMAVSAAFEFLLNSAFSAVAGVSVRGIIREAIRVALARLLASLRASGAAALERIGATTLEHSVAHHIIGLATFGLSILADAATRAYVLNQSGVDAQVAFTPWARDAMWSRSRYLETWDGRRCAALLMGRAMAWDGQLDDLELEFFAAHLARIHDVAGEWVRSDPDEQEALARLAASAADPARAMETDRELAACLDSDFRPLDRVERLRVLADVLVLLSVDGQFSEGETDFHSWLSERLRDGLGMTNLDLTEKNMAFVRAHVLGLLLGEGTDEETKQTVAAVPVEQKLPYLGSVPSETWAMVRCRLAGDCQDRQ